MAVQTTRGNGFANGNSQGWRVEGLGRPISVHALKDPDFATKLRVFIKAGKPALLTDVRAPNKIGLYLFTDGSHVVEIGNPAQRQVRNHPRTWRGGALEVIRIHRLVGRLFCQAESSASMEG